MKKYLIILIAMVCFGISAYADGTKTCKVSGTTGSVEVSVYNGDTEKGTASMSFSNDTDVDVNVRYEIVFYYKNQIVDSKSGSKKVAPHSEVTINDIDIKKQYNDVKVKTVSGEKCY